MLCTFLTLLVTCQVDQPIDAQTVAEVFRSYGSSFKDVQFIYEGTTRSAVELEGEARTFQGYYAYRTDGATLLDVYGIPRKNAETRNLYSILAGKMESLNASPDLSVRLSDREPERSNGGPGSLNRPNSPERIFFAYYLNTHYDPMEFGLETHDWEEVDGHRCLIVTVSDGWRSRAKGKPKFAGSYTKLWVDLERGGNPL